MNPLEDGRDLRMVMLVNKYATPLAILLVGLGLVFSQPMGKVKVISAGLLVFSVMFNLLAMPVLLKMSGGVPWLPRGRMAINILVNMVLVYYLGGYWPSIWMLLALTPIATAIYGGRGKTLVMASGISGALTVIQFTRPENSPADWGELLGRIAFILLLSLMINELALTTREKA